MTDDKRDSQPEPIGGSLEPPGPKLDRQTDPSGLVASLRAATDGRPFLGDQPTVEALLRHFAAEVVTRYDEVGHGVLTPSDAANSDREDCFRLARVFCGQDPAYAPVRQWSGKPLADHLRERMARDLQPEDDDMLLIAQALAVLVHQIYDALRAAADGAPDEAVIKQVDASVRSLAMALLGVVGND